MDRREARLARFYADVTKGKQDIETADDGRLFLEAARRQPSASRLVESILTSKRGLDALAVSVRCDVSDAFLISTTLPLVRCLSDPPAELLSAGQSLKTLVMALLDPPTVWKALNLLVRQSGVPGEGLEAFAWLALYILRLSFQDPTLDEFAGNVKDWVDGGKPVAADATPAFQAYWDKTSEMLKMKSTGLSSDGSNIPGGRHDNDFGDFREILTIPTAQEIRSTELPYYRRAADIANLPLGERPLAHLDNTFRLLREDMLAELREDLQFALRRSEARQKQRRRPNQVLAQIRLRDIVAGGIRGGKCCLVLEPSQGLEKLLRLDPATTRRKALKEQPSYLKHQSFAALCKGSDIIAFGFVVRDENLLCDENAPPAVGFHPADQPSFAKALAAFGDSPQQQHLRLFLVDTPIFAYEPILNQLKLLTEIPLADHLLNPGGAPRASDQKPPVVADFRQGKTTLDHSQSTALADALSDPVTIIQGPPGTGKSFIGAMIAKKLLAEPGVKLLVLSFKNHALDDFLAHLVSNGIKKTDMVRLGGNFDPAMRDITLDSAKSATTKARPRWPEVKQRKEELDSLHETLQGMVGPFLRGATPNELLDYLEFSEHRALFGAFSIPKQEDDGFVLAGKKNKALPRDHLIGRWERGDGPGPLAQGSGNHEPWQMPPEERKQLCRRWRAAVKLEQIESITELAGKCDALQDEVSGLQAEDDRSVVRDKRVIGCTTTAASKYQALLQAAQPDVVLVEEAGEILEAHVLAALGPSVKKLIMIGDHKQLRPRIKNFKLSVQRGDGFDLDRSMFERLIRGEHKFTTLLKQHRSPPQTTNILRLLTYPDLEDAPATLARPDVSGVQQRFVFMNHAHPERERETAHERDLTSKGSKENEFEAHMVLRLVRYLGQQGYKTADMVVLTPYLGQLYLLHDTLRRENDAWLNDLDNHDLRRAGLITEAAAQVGRMPLRISTIDNYQGEQSDIVIASLTRSNDRGDIGFMSQPERLNVLMSRHRIGLFIIGNMATFMESKSAGDLWKRYFTHLKDHGFLFDGLPVYCQQHPGRQAVLMSPDAFTSRCPDGGCFELCGAPLSCGVHVCQRRCHRLSDHSKTPCDTSFDKACDRGHTTSVTCSTKGDSCRECVREDEDKRRRVRRMLTLEEERQARIAQYRRELQQIEDELDHERRLAMFDREAREQKEKLEQQRGDLDTLKATRKRAQEMKELEKTRAERAARAASARSKDAGATDSSSSDKGSPPAWLPLNANQEWQHMKKHEGATSPSVDELMAMVGLESVKDKFLEIKAKVDLSVRQGVRLSDERFGCSFLGNPGTGKTTVARIYGRFLTSMGVIPGARFVETSGAKLANGGVGAAQAMLDDLLDNGGGVVFVDEAYQLSSGNSPGGKAVLDFLLAEVENLTGKVVFLLAGYDREMESFFAHNPGIPSRFPASMQFADYADDELRLILQRRIDDKFSGAMKMEGGPAGLYARIVARRLGQGRGRPGFGNARAVENTVSRIADRQAKRVRREARAKKSLDELLFTKEDMVGPEPAEALQRSLAWKELQSMTGLGAVKQEVKVMMDTLRTNYQRELAEEPLVHFSLNKVFLGNPGTGKTTVAKLYGRILVELGMLSNGEVVVKNPSDFVGAVIGGSEQQTKGILASTVGKVLVIDEAYGLHEGSASGTVASNPFKTAVVDTIVAEVQSVPGDDRCVLLLGYRGPMEAMFQNANPGLARRFPIASAFEFDDFDDAELLQILNLKLKKAGFGATDEAKRVALEVLGRARNRPHFGNAGEIDILLGDAQKRHQKRSSSARGAQAQAQAQRTLLEAVDMDPDFQRAERTDTNIAMLFATDVGREAIVQTLQGYQDHVRLYRKMGLDPKEDIPFSFLFRGPPGTGKTTTAKKMGKVFYDMGFLADTAVEECSATAIIGQYVGQTGPKVQQVMDKALGRVLFIDEAYRLNDGLFGKEALDELVDCLTKPKYMRKMVVILAGYDQHINSLLRANPGLSSRFPATLDFLDLDPQDCLGLLKSQLRKHKAKLDGKAKVTTDMSCIDYMGAEFEKQVLAAFAQLSLLDSWGNARDVATLASGMFRKTVKNVSADGKQVRLAREHIADELDGMLAERRNREAVPTIGGGVPHPQQATPQRSSRATNQSRMPTTTTTTVASAQPPVPQEEQAEQEEQEEQEDDNTEPEKPQRTAESDGGPSNGGPRRVPTRDAGVSDEVWEQLQRDVAEERRKDAEFAALEKRCKAAKDDDDGDRDEIVRQLLEERQRREEEARKRAKLMAMGTCPMGYEWVKQANGYRCGGGSHWMDDGDVDKM